MSEQGSNFRYSPLKYPVAANFGPLFHLFIQLSWFSPGRFMLVFSNILEQPFCLHHSVHYNFLISHMSILLGEKKLSDFNWTPYGALSQLYIGGLSNQKKGAGMELTG